MVDVVVMNDYTYFNSYFMKAYIYNTLFNFTFSQENLIKIKMNIIVSQFPFCNIIQLITAKLIG